MQYTQAQIDRANAVSLEDFLRTQGETLIKSGREYRWKEHDSLTVRGNKWFRHSQSKGGYPIDFVMEFYGKSFPEAVQLLTGESGEEQTEAVTAPPTAFHLPLHNRTADRRASMRLLLPPTQTGNTFIITLSTTPLRWTAPGSSGTFYCPGWPCSG